MNFRQKMFIKFVNISCIYLDNTNVKYKINDIFYSYNKTFKMTKPSTMDFPFFRVTLLLNLYEVSHIKMKSYLELGDFLYLKFLTYL